VRCCHIVRAILHASPGYSLSGMYLAPATGPCYTMCAIRDGRSFRSTIHASRYRASSSALVPFSENLRHCDQSEMFMLRMKEVFFSLRINVCRMFDTFIAKVKYHLFQDSKKNSNMRQRQHGHKVNQSIANF